MLNVVTKTQHSFTLLIFYKPLKTASGRDSPREGVRVYIHCYAWQDITHENGISFLVITSDALQTMPKKWEECEVPTMQFEVNII